MIRKITLGIILATFFMTGTSWAGESNGHFKPLDYFTVPEIVANSVALGANAYLLSMPETSPSFGAPSARSTDWEIYEDHTYLDHEKYEDMSDALLFSMLAIPAITYTTGIFADLPGMDHANVRLLGYLEALNFTQLFTGSAKKLIGRERPDGEDYQSFFSGHSSTTFMAASYFSWDMSAWLRNRLPADAGVATKLLVGSIPFAALYTAAGLTAYYRIAAEKHWFSDVMTGSLVGIGCGNFFYLLHFRPDGKVKKRSDTTAAVYPVITPEITGVAVTWRF